ncbi:MAG: hypothetical protein AAB348_01420 [Patescibacteria group bacterium]
MTDKFMRHMAAIAATIVCLLAYYSGWISGTLGLWWTVFAVLIIYLGVYKILSK